MESLGSQSDNNSSCNYEQNASSFFTQQAESCNVDDETSDNLPESKSHEATRTEEDADDGTNYSQDANPTSLMDQRERNIKRNNEYLESIGLLSKKKTKTVYRPKTKTSDLKKQKVASQRMKKGMLLFPYGTPLSSGVSLLDKYPGREQEIRTLSALLGSASCCNTSHAPTPIFVTGPSGCGKTAAIRDLLNEQKVANMPNCLRLFDIYIDFATLDDHSLDTVIAYISTRLEKQVKAYNNDELNRPTKEKSDSQPDTTCKEGSEPIVSALSVITGDTGTLISSFAYFIKHVLSNCYHAVLVLDNVECIAESTNIFSQLLMIPNVYGINMTVIAITRNTLLDFNRTNTLIPISESNTTIGECVKPFRVRFGSYKDTSTLKKILHSSHLWTIIVGHANGNHSLDSSVTTMLRESFLTVIIKLLNNVTSNINVYVRLARDLWPEYTAPLLSDQIQATIESLSLSNLSVTESDKKVAEFLSSRVWKHTRDKMDNLYNILAHAHSDLPDGRLSKISPVGKYMLVASYLCQVNRSENDRKLFSAQKSGRRSRNSLDQGDNSKNTAFGTDKANSFASRPNIRLFPIERMLSIFASLVKLNGFTTDSHNHDDASSIPAAGIYHELSHLRHLGYLSDPMQIGEDDPVQLYDAKLYCNVTQDEAQEIAAGINLDLDRYTN